MVAITQVRILVTAVIFTLINFAYTTSWSNLFSKPQFFCFYRKFVFLYIDSWYRKNGSMNYVLFSSSLLSCMPLKDVQRIPTIQGSNVVAFIDTENRNALRFIYFYPVHTFIFSFSCFASHYRYPSKVQHFHFTITIVKQFMIYKLYQRNTKLF